MCRIDGSTNSPIDNITSNISQLAGKVIHNVGPVVFICRRGNDSQIAARMLLQKVPEDQRWKVKDLVGGLHAWAKDVDDDFPIY